MPRADRIFALVQMISGLRFRALEELTAELRVSPRSVYRDLSDLEERGLPIEREDGRYRISPAASVRPLPLSDRDRVLLSIVLDAPQFHRFGGYFASLAELRQKLATVHALPKSAGIVEAGPDRTGTVPEAVVSALERAIRERHSVSMLYVSLSGRQKKWRGVDPWLLVHRSDAWYLIGRCHTRDEARTFRLDRIEAVLPIGSSFAVPEAFDASGWFENSWSVAHGKEGRDVVVVFDESIAPLVAHAQHHPSEEKRRLGDGSLEYRVRIGDLDEIARWICGFGGAARVVAPEELVDRVHAIASGAAAVHRRRAAAMTRRK